MKTGFEKILKGAAVLGLSVLIMALPAGPAAAKPSGRQNMTYEVYASGVHVVQAGFDVDFRARDKYTLALDAKTQGFLGALAPWEGTFESRGWVLKDNDFRPEMHRSSDLWRGEGETRDYRYGSDRSFKGLTITRQGQKSGPEKIDGKLTQGTTDVLSAGLTVMQAVAEGGECAGESEVFDGSRRFRLIFRSEGFVELEPSRYNIYRGRAAQCSVEVVPMGGAWHKKPRGWMSIQEQGRDRGMMPTLWLAKISEDGPAVPVKIRVKTAYGTLFMHLVDYRNGAEDRPPGKQD